MKDLIELFAEELDTDASLLNDESSPDSVVQWDSTATMGLVAAIEEAFGVELTTAEIMKMRAIGLARKILRSKGVNV